MWVSWTLWVPHLFFFLQPGFFSFKENGYITVIYFPEIFFSGWGVSHAYFMEWVRNDHNFIFYKVFSAINNNCLIVW